MFHVGDRVVYPMHGAGVIQAIEEREIGGELQTYYVIHLPLGDMRLMLPTRAVEHIGLRRVVNDQALQEVFRVLRCHRDRVQAAWNRRYRAHLEKMRSGDIVEVAEVVRNLSDREREKGLSSGERKMLDNARQILLSEIILSKDLPEEQASSMLDQALAL